MAIQMIDLSVLPGSVVELLNQAAATGDRILIVQDGVACAILQPVPPGQGRRTPGLHPGAFEASADFDEPLAEALWLGTP